MTAIEKELKKFEKIKSDRKIIDSVWEELAFYFSPTLDIMNRYLSKDKLNTDKKRRLIFDSTPEQASKFFASRMQILLCNPEKRWFKLKHKIKKLQKNAEIIDFVENIIQDTLDLINEPRANFYEQLRNALNNISVFGIGALIIDEESGGTLKFRNINLSNYFYDENYQGIINCHYLEEKIKGSDLIYLQQEAGYADVGLQEADNDKGFTIIRKIYRNPQYNPKVLSFETAKWQSTVILKEKKAELKKEFYNECPIAVGRWDKIQNSIYPDSIGRLVLADVKYLNNLEAQLIEIVDLIKRPAMSVTAGSKLAEIDLSPDGVNVIHGETIKDILAPTYVPNMDLNRIEAKAEQKRVKINTAFYMDMFSNMQDTNAGDYTATEVNIRDQNNLRLLAPKITHLQSEFISAIIDRVASIVLKRDPENLKAINPSLDNLNFKITYESEISTSYRLTDLNTLLSYIGNVSNISTVQANLTGSADSTDNVDFDKVIQEVGDIMGVSNIAQRSEEDIQQIREAKAQQQQQQAEMMQAQQASEVAKNMPQEKVQ